MSFRWPNDLVVTLRWSWFWLWHWVCKCLPLTSPPLIIFVTPLHLRMKFGSLYPKVKVCFCHTLQCSNITPQYANHLIIIIVNNAQTLVFWKNRQTSKQKKSSTKLYLPNKSRIDRSIHSHGKSQKRLKFSSYLFTYPFTPTDLVYFIVPSLKSFIWGKNRLHPVAWRIDCLLTVLHILTDQNIFFMYKWTMKVIISNN